MRILLIDDIRNLKADIIARNFEDGKTLLEKFGPWDLLLLDHDLACFDDKGKEYTGYDILCWLEEFPEFLPKKIQLVTDNPVGIEKMRKLIIRLYERNKV